MCLPYQQAFPSVPSQTNKQHAKAVWVGHSRCGLTSRSLLALSSSTCTLPVTTEYMILAMIVA